MDMPWKNSSAGKEDMKWFKDQTTSTGNNQITGSIALIMGRKTWESIPKKFRPLGKRINIVISSANKMIMVEGMLTESPIVYVPSFQAAVEWCVKNFVGRIVVIGGCEIYKQAIEHSFLETAWVTRFAHNYNCDLHFPLDLLAKKLSECQIVRKTEYAEYIKYTKCTKT